MNAYIELIQQEEQKLALLRLKVAQCEHRIATLRSLVDTDDVDAAVAKQIGQQPAVVENTVGQKEENRSDQRAPGIRMRRDSVAMDVLPFIGAEGKRLDDVMAYLRSIGKSINRGSLRTILMNLRVNNRLLENPQPGFYKLSADGIRWLERHKKEAMQEQTELIPVTTEELAEEL